MSNMFDPKKKYGSGDGGSHGVPPAEYIQAMTWFERRTAKSGKPYMRVKYTVCAGSAKDKGYFAALSLDTDSAGAMTRLSLLAEKCGVEEAFDLDDDDAFRRAFMLRPFKARVKRETKNGYTNNDIERFLDMTAAEEKIAQAWVLDYEEQAEYDGDGGSPGRGNSSGGSKASDFDDDDQIPF